MVRRFLGSAPPAAPLDPGSRLVGIITPHAGYVYSGAVAGRAWSLVARAGAVRTVVVLGPSHHRSRSTASTIDTDAYRTPIGDVPIAVDVVRALVGDGSGLVRMDPDVLAPEHSVDVQMPFIHVALPGARVVPIVVPFVSADRLEALAGVLFRVLPRDGSAIVAASSDLSHFFDYATAQEVDREIEAEIAAGDTAALLAHHDQRRGPCGVAPIVVLLSYAKHVAASSRVTTIERINSGDTSGGDKARVVGYLAALVTASR